ncbi:hypothetical protein IJI31_02755 [bacterium]|nr:hypothetical protein [bacterium]
MEDEIKNLKIANEEAEENQKLKWLDFSHAQDKTSSDYIGMVTSDSELKSHSDEKRLEAMVREQLKIEFPNIENYNSYEMLVDAVMYNIKRKQLQAMDDIEIK